MRFLYPAAAPPLAYLRVPVEDGVILTVAVKLAERVDAVHWSSPFARLNVAAASERIRRMLVACEREQRNSALARRHGVPRRKPLARHGALRRVRVDGVARYLHAGEQQPLALAAVQAPLRMVHDARAGGGSGLRWRR